MHFESSSGDEGGGGAERFDEPILGPGADDAVVTVGAGGNVGGLGNWTIKLFLLTGC